MISRQTKLQLLVFLLISAVGLSYTAVRYAGLGRFFLDQGYVVSADFEDSGGIFKGAEVTYRGVPSGKVEQLDLIDGGVRVDLRMRPGTKIPTDVRALVGNRSAVGEQFVDLQPKRQDGPFLRAGETIPRDRTQIPISPTQLVVDLDDLVRSINTDDLATVLSELGTAFGDGAGDSLQRLVDSGDVLTRAALDALPETKKLIEDGETALNTQRDVRGEFLSFNKDLKDLTSTLRSSDPDFRRLYANGTASANELTDLIRKNESDLPVLLGNLLTVAQIQKVRLPGIRQILVTYPNVVAGGFTVAPGDGTTHFGLVTNNDPPVCTRGYESTNKRPPADVTRKTPNLAAGCQLPDGSPSDVRGARRAPRPAGTQPFGGATASGGSRIPNLGEADAAATDDTTTTLFGDYDPKTGRVITDDGQRVSIGGTSGAARAFGNDSWQWLLLGPLSK